MLDDPPPVADPDTVDDPWLFEEAAEEVEDSLHSHLLVTSDQTQVPLLLEEPPPVDEPPLLLLPDEDEE